MTPHIYRIGHMDCAGCAREVEHSVRRLDGVRAVQVDFATARMTLEGEVDPDALRKRVEALGKTLEDIDGAAGNDPTRGGVMGFWDYLTGRLETRLALIGGAIVLLTLIATALVDLPERVTAAAYLIGMAITAWPIARSGFNALVINREFTINLLMTVAAVGAALIGETLEAGTVIFLFAIGEALEGYTADRARRGIRALISLRPSHALRIEGSHEQLVPVAELRIDDRLLVRPGEQIPMDGVIMAGAGGVNQAPITGESLPVAKGPGDGVYAGTINGESALEIRVTRLAADNTLSRIIRLVEEAQSVRAPSQRLIDRFAQVYTPAVMALALLVAVIPPLLFNAPFYDAPDQRGWLYRALSMLVIACPCALVISTPVTVISAITAAARGGVLIKGGAHLEALGHVRVIAFDKTGTLTLGQPTVTQMRSVDCATGDPCALCDDVLALGAAVERRSTHPLAKAVVEAAQARSLAEAYPAAEAVETLAGRGVRGWIGGRPVTVGSHALFDAEIPHAAQVCAWVNEAESHGQTTILVGEGDQVRGFISLADQSGAEAAAVIAELHALGIKVAMLTGDNPNAARRIADHIGVDDLRAGLLPQHKVDALHDLTARYGRVAMVGDGINDTPALAAASVGVAMGGAGSAGALETADIALMGDDLRGLPFAVRLARQTRRLIAQNVILSFGLKALFLVLALMGAASLWLAILADVGMSLLVTLNGMRPLSLRREEES